MSLPSLKLFLQRSQMNEPSRYWNDGLGPAKGGGLGAMTLRPRMVPTPRDMMVTPLPRFPARPRDVIVYLSCSSLTRRIFFSRSSRS